MAALAAGPAAAQERKPASGESGEYSRREIRWAAGWINREVALYMARDIVKKIIARETLFELHVGDQWYELAFSRQGQFLQNLSRAREITGHAPFFVVRDHENKDIIARVSPRGIEVSVPNEGMFTYRASADVSFNTTY